MGYFFHNGVVSGLGSKTFSDTYVLSRSIKTLNTTQRANVLNHIAKKSSSHFCVLTESNVEFFGKKWFDYQNLIFSNLYWEREKHIEKCDFCGYQNRSQKFLCANCGQILPAWYYGGH